MANAVLFVGWGQPVPGYEKQANQVFGEGFQHWQQWQQQGEIDSFEVVGLEPHGGDLSGFLLMHGDPEKLARLRSSDEFQRDLTRAGIVVQHLGVVMGVTGEALQALYADYLTHATELAKG